MTFAILSRVTKYVELYFHFTGMVLRHRDYSTLFSLIDFTVCLIAEKYR
jgi:hypothetical protein